MWNPKPARRRRLNPQHYPLSSTPSSPVRQDTGINPRWVPINTPTMTTDVGTDGVDGIDEDGDTSGYETCQSYKTCKSYGTSADYVASTTSAAPVDPANAETSDTYTPKTADSSDSPDISDTLETTDSDNEADDEADDKSDDEADNKADDEADDECSPDSEPEVSNPLSCDYDSDDSCVSSASSFKYCCSKAEEGSFSSDCDECLARMAESARKDRQRKIRYKILRHVEKQAKLEGNPKPTHVIRAIADRMYRKYLRGESMNL